MYKLLLCLVFFIQYQKTFAHVALTFPPARTYIFDYFDNSRFARRGPCGMSKTEGAPATTLIAGSTITVTWHLSYPHEGGSKLELIRELGGERYDVVRDLTGGFRFREDSVRQSAVVTLPNEDCRDCAIRLVRQGTEYFSSYAFWSCADVSIVQCDEVSEVSSVPETTLSPLEVWIKGILERLEEDSALHRQLLNYIEENDINLNPPAPMEATCSANGPVPNGCYDGYCMNGGTCDMTTGQCQCHRLFAGDRCQYKDECWTDEDCSYNGKCINTRATTYPILKCYCERGWFGVACDRVSEITEIRDDYDTNPNYERRELLARQVFMYWRYVKDVTEIEVVMRVLTHSWVGVGWKSSDTTTRCKQLEPVLEVEAKHAEAQRLLLQKQASFTTTRPDPARDPEIDVENRLGSNLEARCPLQTDPPRRNKRSAKRVRRQSNFRRVRRGMDCADITIGSVKGNLSRVQDMWTPDCSVPMPDAYFGGTDDITSAYGTQENGFTTIAFRKRLQANHFSDHRANDGEQVVIWARGQDVNKYAHSPRNGLDNCQASDLRFYRHDELKYHGGNYIQRNKGRAFFVLTMPTPPATTPSNPNPSNAATTCSNSGEFRSPRGCFATEEIFNCDFYVSWQIDDNNNVVFTMKGTQSSSNRYLALGISDDQLMPETDIYVGYFLGGNFFVQDSYVQARQMPSRDTEQNVNVISGSFVDNVMTFVFSRPLTSTNSRDLDFSQCRYLMLAKSLQLNGRFTQHGNNDRFRVVSPQRLMIFGDSAPSVAPTSAPTPSPASSPTPSPTSSVSPSSCSQSSGEIKDPANCISSDVGFNCDFYASWILENDIISFTMKGTQTSPNGYIALGISDDRRMPSSDMVTGYIGGNGSPVVQDRYAPGPDYSFPIVDDEQDISNISGSYVNGVLTMMFSRPHTSSSPFDIGFSECRFLLYAKGQVQNNDITFHSFRRLTSERICIGRCS